MPLSSKQPCEHSCRSLLVPEPKLLQAYKRFVGRIWIQSTTETELVPILQCVCVCMYVCVSCPGDQLRANRQSSCELIQSKHCSLGKSSRPYGYRSCSHMTVSRHCTKTHVQQEHMLLQDLVSALHTVRERGTRVGNCLLWYLNSEVLISADKQRHVTEQASML